MARARLKEPGSSSSRAVSGRSSGYGMKPDVDLDQLEVHLGCCQSFQVFSGHLQKSELFLEGDVAFIMAAVAVADTSCSDTFC